MESQHQNPNPVLINREEAEELVQRLNQTYVSGVGEGQVTSSALAASLGLTEQEVLTMLGAMRSQRVHSQANEQVEARVREHRILAIGAVFAVILVMLAGVFLVASRQSRRTVVPESVVAPQIPQTPNVPIDIDQLAPTFVVNIGHQTSTLTAVRFDRRFRLELNEMLSTEKRLMGGKGQKMTDTPEDMNKIRSGDLGVPSVLQLPIVVKTQVQNAFSMTILNDTIPVYVGKSPEMANLVEAKSKDKIAEIVRDLGGSHS